MNNKNDFFTIFIFPFKYEMKGDKELKPDEVAEILKKEEKNNWTKEDYKLNSINYNEFYYFHPYVQGAIFNKKGNVGMEFLRRTDFNKLKVEYYDKDNNKKVIETQVNEIDIHLFDNQIGLLTITTEKLKDDGTTGYEDFLHYNDITRRVYPPYLGDKNTCSPKLESKLLPVEITLLKDNGKPISEDFPTIDLKVNEEKDIVCLSRIIQRLLDPFELKHTHKMEMDRDKIYYTPFIDDRMFIVSYYSDNEVSDKLKNRCCDGYVYETSDDWYRYIFVDGGGAGIANNAMKKELITKHTYTRWAGEGSLFGMSRYSFVLLCSTEAPSYLKQHMKSMYYQMALIVLFQRAMLLKFAEDVDEVTKEFDMDSLSEIKEKTKRLHGDFIKFINKYWFVEVTPQEQGIEIYNQWMGLLNLGRLYNEVQREISELAGYVENKIESETNRKVAVITYIGLPLMIASIILSIWPVYEERINTVIPYGFCEVLKKSFHVNSFNFLWPILLISGILSFVFIKVLFWLIPKIERVWYRFKLKIWKRN